MTSKLQKILFIPDTHRPYHDKKAVEVMMKAAKAFKPHHVILQGDYADFYAVSSHSKDPRRTSHLQDEIDDVIAGLKELKTLKAKNYVFIAGNHEDRLTRYLMDNAPELYNNITIPAVLQLDKLGYKYVPYKEYYKIGKLNITHDTGTAGRSAHLKSMDDFQGNVLIGHTHRMHYSVEGNTQGEKHLAASFGWLGDTAAVDYMHKAKIERTWTTGFGIGYLDPKTQVVYVVPVPIINNTCMVEGQLYKV